MIRPSWLTESSGSSDQTIERDTIEAPSLDNADLRSSSETYEQQGRKNEKSDGDDNGSDEDDIEELDDAKEQAIIGAVQSVSVFFELALFLSFQQLSSHKFHHIWSSSIRTLK